MGVLVHRNAAAPAVAIQVWVQAGSADEREGQLGLAHVHEHMLFKGTERRPVGRIAAEIEAAGGEINAYTSYDQTVYHVVMSSRFFERGLDVLADAIQHPAFDVGELSRELKVIDEEIQRCDDSAPRVAAKLLFAEAFRVHPYRRPVIGSAESVAALRRPDVLRFYERWYTGSNVVVIAVGNLSEAEAADQIASAFADLPRGEARQERPPEPPQAGLRFVRQEAHFRQVHVNAGFHIPALDHPDVPALDILGLIAGQGDSSRLARSIKRDRGLVNDVVVYAYTPRDPGLLVATLTTSPQRAREATIATLEELFRLHDEPVEAHELEKARTIVESQRTYERESVQGQARKLGFYETLAGGPELEEDYLARVRALTPSDLQRVARRYLTADNLTVAVLAPEGGGDGLDAATMEAALETIAPAVESPALLVGSGEGEPIFRTLSSGARVMVLSDCSVPLVALRVAALGGLGWEEKGGACRLMSNALTRGTTTRSGAEIARSVESMAAGLQASSGRASVGLRMSALCRSLDAAWEIFVDVLRRPAFPEDEVQRERTLLVEQIRNQRDRPAAWTIRELVSTMFSGHPWGRSILGSEESVDSITRDDLLAIHAKTLAPSRLVLGVCGDVDPDAIFERVDAAFKDGPAAGPHEVGPGPLPPRVGPLETRIRGRGQQAHIALGYPGLRFSSDLRPALDVLITVLSGQSGRLFLQLRDKRSLAYSVTASSFEGCDHGYLLSYMGTSPDRIGEGLAAMQEVLGSLREEPITPAELARAQQYIVGTFDVGLQRRSARAAAYAYNVLFGSPDRRLSDYTDRILSVTAADVQALAAQLLVEDAATVCIFEPEAGGV